MLFKMQCIIIYHYWNKHTSSKNEKPQILKCTIVYEKGNNTGWWEWVCFTGGRCPPQVPPVVTWAALAITAAVRDVGSPRRCRRWWMWAAFAGAAVGDMGSPRHYRHRPRGQPPTGARRPSRPLPPAGAAGVRGCCREVVGGVCGSTTDAQDGSSHPPADGGKGRILPGEHLGQ